MAQKQGTFSASLIPYLAAGLSGGSILLVYWIAQWLGHQKPFPSANISATAKHYPEYIYFRIGTISGSVLSLLAYFINYFWILTMSYQHAFNIKAYKPKITLILGIGSSLFLMGSTANLDTGKTNVNLHVFCAVNFFFWSVFSAIHNSYINWVLYKHLKCVGKISTLIKVVLSILLIIQVYMDLNVHNFEFQSINSPLSNILEYTLAYSIIFNIALIGWDVRNYNLTYDRQY